MNYDIVFEETGETRPPREGEWFRGCKGDEVQARFDFSAQSFPILRMHLVEASCDVADDAEDL